MNDATPLKEASLPKESELPLTGEGLKPAEPFADLPRWAQQLIIREHEANVRDIESDHKAKRYHGAVKHSLRGTAQMVSSVDSSLIMVGAEYASELDSELRSLHNYSVGLINRIRELMGAERVCLTLPGEIDQSQPWHAGHVDNDD